MCGPQDAQSQVLGEVAITMSLMDMPVLINLGTQGIADRHMRSCYNSSIKSNDQK